MKRDLLKGQNVPRLTGRCATIHLPKQVCRTLIDFSSLHLPSDVAFALADAFWNHVGHRSSTSILVQWQRMKTFSRFAFETNALQSLLDINSEFLIRYIEWLHSQRRPNGEPWRAGSKASAYNALRTLLQWIQRCRPGVLGYLRYPFNPFPWRSRDARRNRTLSAEDLRAILQACERDIEQLRALRANARGERATEPSKSSALATANDLIDMIDKRFGGFVPSESMLRRAGNSDVRSAVRRYGGSKQVELLLYPQGWAVFPYYLSIVIHTAGNPEPIAALGRDCLQPIPLLDDREVLTWSKPRAGGLQRRSFRTHNPFEPPALVRELLEWTERLSQHAALAHRPRLFLYKGQSGVSALSQYAIRFHLERFQSRHGLPRFALASLRPSVLTAFYRASGDLRKVKEVANHAQLSTTVRYVEGPETEALHRRRIGALQAAFVGRIEGSRSSPIKTEESSSASSSRASPEALVPPGPVVTMFGFECRDPYAGIAPGSRRGELCTNFLACLTCPNAIIPPDPLTLARLLQARDHLRESAAHLHPARWDAIYAPQLRILDEDILTRFAHRELVDAQRLVCTLPPLADLR